MNSALCDIGCDEYGYPILSAHDADMQNANEPIPPGDYEMRLEIYSESGCVIYSDLVTYSEGVEVARKTLSEAQRQPLSASWHHLACITAPPPRTMPARALFCQRMAIGIR